MRLGGPSAPESRGRGPAAGSTPRDPAPAPAAVLAAGAILTGAGWAVMWGIVSFFNPLAFAAMWTGAALLMWWGSRAGYPGWRRHLWLATVSVPVWWWFELVDTRTGNWHYVNPFTPGLAWYVLLSSVAFATVVPAVTAAAALLRRFAPGGAALPQASAGFARREIAAGIVLQALVFVLPTQMYPFVWIAPFLVVDGAAALLGEGSLAEDMRGGGWREAALLGAAGLMCGLLWEFWNYWSVPSWEYTVPLLGFWKIFEMPLLGYLGYIPFAWSIVRLVDVLDSLWARRRSRRRQSAAST